MTSRGTRAGAVVLVLASVGCAGSRPAPEIELTVPIPVEWESADAASSAGPDLPDLWWQVFEDPNLTLLVERALDSNRDLRSAAARLDGALAQARIAGAVQTPQANLSVDGARRKQNFIGLPIPGAEGRVLSNTSTTVGAALNVSWEVDLWGRLANGTSAAVERARAAGFEFEDVRLSLSGQTAKAWFSFVEASNQVRLASETLENRTRVRERIERRYAQGLRTALDLRLATANEANAEARYAARGRQLEAIRRQLEVLVARDPVALELLDLASRQEPPGLPELPDSPVPGLPSETLGRRPDLRASERRLAAAGFDVAASRKLLYPRLTLNGSTGTTSPEIEDLLDTDFSVWSLAAGLLQPLFQGGRLRAGVELSEAGLREALARHESAVLGALADVEAQLAADVFLRDQRQAVAKAEEASSAAERLAQDRYFSGLADYLSVLTAAEQATAAASQLLEIDRQRLEQRVDLYLALGGSAPTTGAPPEGIQ